MQVSLDGMTERPDGRTDFIGTGADTFDWDVFDQPDACVLGRVMYPEYENYWRTIQADPTAPMEWSGQPPTPDEVRYAKFAHRTPHYMLSRTIGELDWPVAQVVSDLLHVPVESVKVRLMRSGRLSHARSRRAARLDGRYFCA